MQNRHASSSNAFRNPWLWVVGVTLLIGVIAYSFSFKPEVPAQTFQSAAYRNGVVVGPSQYAGDNFASRYYQEKEITPLNVGSLKLAWDVSTGDAQNASTTGLLASSIGFECSPIICNGHMIVVTPTEELVALDPGTGEQLWKFVPPGYIPVVQVNRGAACWNGPADDPHPHRILYSSGRKFCEIDADTGKLIDTFGNHGVIDLADDVARGNPQMVRYNSPALIVGDTAICGSAIDDDILANSPSGEVRAFDIHTGKLRWSWDMIPHSQDDPARKTWEGSSADTTGSGNVWSMMSYDASRHLIYLPTTSPANDDFGGTRLGDDRNCNSIICLDSDTGKYVWSFQVVHHDIWDYDIPAQPLLFDFNKNGESIPAVAVATKMGRVFLFNRITGVPLFPIREVPVRQTDVPGEKTSPTQPVQDLPPPLVPQTVTPADAWGVDPESQQAAVQMLSQLRSGPSFNPPSLQGTVHNPGRYGGCNWAGMTYDQKNGTIIVTATNDPFFQRLVPRTSAPGYRGAFPMHGTPFIADIGELMVKGFPVVKPPWGKMVAIDPVTGQFRWERPVGYLPEAETANFPGYQDTGSPVVGGAITTASGLIFLAGTRDQHFRAFASDTGKELFSIPLPSVAAALPVIYTVNGKEFIAISCGGHGFLRSGIWDHVMAFALPDNAVK